ncbi:MAG: tRNA(Ile)-lysidine synthase [bacterium ADurb.Bin243]|nr:MAG: tRNA(Ile)-lysidine synthase [bacterium ADurb.Bin243]
MKNIFEIKFFDFIKKNGLIRPGDKILVAYSGGLDSSCLLYLLNKLRSKLAIDLGALYLNHQIRSETELAEEIRFIAENCKKTGVELIIEKADVAKAASEGGLSLEEAARNARYEILKSAAAGRGYNKIATAHHLDDSAETAVMKLVKGASPSAMAGISESAGNVVRPLMFALRSEIEEYAALNDIGYCQDSTNRDIKYERNFVRNEIMPLIKRLNPNFASKLSIFGEIQKRENDFIDSAAVNFFKTLCRHDERGIVFGAAEFAGLHLAVKRRFILHALRVLCGGANEANFAVVSSALDFIEKKNGGEYRELITGKFYASRAADFDPASRYGAFEEKITFGAVTPHLRFEGEGFPCLTVAEGETKSCDCAGFNYVFSLGAAPAAIVPAGAHEFGFFLRREAAAGPLVIRRFREGDKIKLYGPRGGTQKLSDLFTNAKIYGPLRKFIPVICAADGEIFAVCNVKLSAYAIRAGEKNSGEAGQVYFSAISKRIL